MEVTLEDVKALLVEKELQILWYRLQLDAARALNGALQAKVHELEAKLAGYNQGESKETPGEVV